MTQPAADRRRSSVWPLFGGLTVVYVVLIGGMVILTDRGSGGTSETVTERLSEWSITGDSSVAAGDVTFVVKNDGTMEHEMLVLQTETPADQLEVTDAGDPPVPVTEGANKVDEDASIGETGDPNLQPGETRTFVLKDMAPGHYVLICNLEDHYQNGMRIDFTVTS